MDGSDVQRNVNDYISNVDGYISMQMAMYALGLK